MRVKTGTGWVEMGPGRAVATAPRGATIPGLPIGRMDAKPADGLSTIKGGRREDGKRLGIKRK